MADRFNLGSFVESIAYAALDEIFAEFRSDDGFARPSRYEVFFFPPVSRSQTNIFAQIMGQSVADQTARKTALRCEAFEFPGRNLDSAPDTNIYGPEREIVQGYSYGDVTAVFQCSSDMKEKRFFETWQRLAYNPQTWSMQYYNDYSFFYIDHFCLWRKIFIRSYWCFIKFSKNCWRSYSYGFSY